MTSKRRYVTMKKKGQNLGLNGLIAAGVSLVILAVVLTIGSNVVDEVKGTQCTINGTTGDCVTGTNTTASGVADGGLQGIDQLASWQSIIALVIAAGVVIGIIMMALAPRAGL